MHGFGPAILAAVPMDHAGTMQEIREAMVKEPERSTLQKHLGILVGMGCVQREGRGRYRRLVESSSEVLA